jgi:hypothetical protein
MHTVYPFKGNEERRSVSFNAFIDEKSMIFLYLDDKISKKCFR